MAFIDGARPSERKYKRVIEMLKEEPLSERDLVRKGNFKSNQVRTIKYDLIDQGIINEVLYGKVKKFEYQYNAPNFDYSRFETLRLAKLKDLDSMIGYVNTSEPRMKYLCSFLDSDEK